MPIARFVYDPLLRLFIDERIRRNPPPLETLSKSCLHVSSYWRRVLLKRIQAMWKN